MVVRLLSIGALLAIFGAWGLFVAAIGGNTVDVPGTWDFSQTGVLGDSFGVISAFMATAAAIFTFNTLHSERRQADRREVADRRREAEQTFFQLLALRNELIASITVRAGFRTLKGLDALAHIGASLVAVVRDKEGEAARAAYCDLYDAWRDHLGHYFRHTYHVAVFADENFDDGDNYKYVRWVRAQMTNSEQTLLALNCLYGEGRKKFKGLVEFHAMLHNIHPNERQMLNLDLLFEPSAFDLPPPSVLRPGWLKSARRWLADRITGVAAWLRGGEGQP